jgi:cyclopropane-fatty-acyl-phospholipid synthase
MWDYYLAYCEVGFDNGTVDLAQAVFRVPENGESSASDRAAADVT